MIVLEVLGSVAFVAGFLLPLVVLGHVVHTAGALISVHAPTASPARGGCELVLVLGLAALALGFNGGRLSLDHVLFRRNCAGGRRGSGAENGLTSGAGGLGSSSPLSAGCPRTAREQ
ncbi:DoxX family protein [Amycolatopsis sp. FDAARGOS 1241]|uniref:DoxX family protein n=1 Tax=Amycolatopsis sp. FDAARGOS 1241 TaxID=2778070 RepID=UPI001951D303|nr:DoxX family protein [Amycolatopsis sp. FDAARGOS 1241]QRP45121.1 DoxX family protein [Amycolatopsis sp. FDAARGOS 1241]